jgi:hypothetical protein
LANRHLLQERHGRIAPGTAAAVREMAGRPGGLGRPGGGAELRTADTLAVWDGGALDAAVAERYLAALPADARARLAAASEEETADFVRQLSVREIRLGDARRLGIEPDPATLAGLDRMHQADVARIRAGLAEGGDTPPTEATLDRYMERLVSRQVAFQPLPPLFRAWLLEPVTWHVDADAVREATESARRLLAATRGGAQGGGR